MSAMTHSYRSQYPPDVAVDPAIMQFFENLYETMDNPETHEEYVDFYSKDATLIMASTAVKGHEEIFRARQAAWTHVAKRVHTVHKIFPFGTGPGVKDFMLYGDVAYEMKDGRKPEVPWAARARLVKEGERWVFGFYQVYLDTLAQQGGK